MGGLEAEGPGDGFENSKLGLRECSPANGSENQPTADPQPLLENGYVFAVSYANQNERDYAALEAAVASGRILAEEGV